MTIHSRKGKAIADEDDEDDFYTGGSMTNGKGKGKTIDMGFQDGRLEDEDNMY